MHFLPYGFFAASAIALCALTSSCGKTPPREYEVLNAPPPDRPEDLALNATLILEVINVDSSLFEEWIAENALISDAATPLRKSAQHWVHDGDATIEETITLSVRDGSSSQIESQQIVFSSEDNYRLRPHTLGSSMEATLTINPDSRRCSVELNPTSLNPDTTSSDSPPTGNHWNWSGTNINSSISLPEMTYGFLGSRIAVESAPKRKRSPSRTSLFFLRADTNLPPLSEPPPTSPL